MRNKERFWKPINESLGAGINRGLQHLLDAAEQAPLRFGGESVGARSRVDAGLKEDLIGIDVVNPGDHRLVDQKGLYIAFATGERPVECRKIKLWVKRIRAEPLLSNECVSVAR